MDKDFKNIRQNSSILKSSKSGGKSASYILLDRKTWTKIFTAYCKSLYQQFKSSSPKEE